jgi:hypothetical protein
MTAIKGNPSFEIIHKSAGTQKQVEHADAQDNPGAMVLHKRQVTLISDDVKQARMRPGGTHRHKTRGCCAPLP